jgi:hypothetical protein
MAGSRPRHERPTDLFCNWLSILMFYTTTATMEAERTPCKVRMRYQDSPYRGIVVRQTSTCTEVQVRVGSNRAWEWAKELPG